MRVALRSLPDKEDVMDRNSWIAVGVVCLASALAGCSGAGGDNPGPSAGGTSGSGGFNFGGSAATGIGGSGGSATGGADAGADSGSSGGSSGGPPAYVSNTPGAAVAESPSAGLEGLTVVSSNLTDEVSGSQYYQRWTGLLYNGTPKVVCFAQVTAKFFNSAGGEVGSHLTFADAPPHLLTSGSLPSACLQPGTVGGLFSNGFFNAPLSAGGVANISFEIDGSAKDAVPLHPSAPKFSSVMLTEKYGSGSGYWAATGSLTAVATIYNIGIDVYPVGADGLIPDRLGDTHLDTLTAGSSYAFDTTTYQGTPANAQLLAFSSFIDGAKSFAAMPPELESSVDTPEELAALAAAATTPAQHRTARRLVRDYQRRIRRGFEANR